jgi:hypothetical protein
MAHRVILRWRGNSVAFGLKQTLGRILWMHCLGIPRVVHGVDALVVEGAGDAEQIPARQIGKQERVTSHFVEPRYIAGQQCIPLVGCEIARGDSGDWVAFDRLAKGEIVQSVVAQLVDGINAHCCTIECYRHTTKAWP